jgi:hypothetical protein
MDSKSDQAGGRYQKFLTLCTFLKQLMGSALNRHTFSKKLCRHGFDKQTSVKKCMEKASDDYVIYQHIEWLAV